MKPARHTSIVEGGLCIILALVMLGSLCIGSYPVSLSTVARIVLSLALPESVRPEWHWTPEEQVAVQVIRLPRVLLATLAGLGLGLSGSALQGMLRNPLVGPDVVGVSAGAACGGVMAILLDFSPALLMATALAGGMGALMSAIVLGRLANTGGTLALVIAGVIVSSFFTAILGLMQFLADPNEKLPGMIFWLMGSFAAADQQKVLLIAGALAVGGTILLGLRWRLNLLSLGDMDAQGLGVKVEQLRWLVVFLVSLIVAAQVAVSGMVGWIGMVVPHFARMLVGPDHVRLLPTSMLIGGIFLLGMDDLARTLATQELPIGLLTAIIGTPVFAIMFWKTNSGGWERD